MTEKENFFLPKIELIKVQKNQVIRVDMEEAQKLPPLKKNSCKRTNS